MDVSTARTHDADGGLPDDLDLNWEDLKMAAVADRTRRETHIVRQWWLERQNALAERVEIVTGLDDDERAFGFCDTTVVDGQTIPVMGVVQEMVYDRRRAGTPETVRDQLREFVLGYFMRVSHGVQPVTAATPHAPVPFLLRPLSWIPDPSDTRIGFGYEQLLWKSTGTGRVGKFDLADRNAIVDLRRLGPEFEWLATRVNLYDFKIAMSPFGPDRVRLEMPMKEVTYLLLTPELIVDRAHPRPGVVAEFGFGYGLLPYTPEPGIFAYGPGHFTAGFQSFEFSLTDTGEVHSKAVFVVNRPDRILNVDVDPVGWSFRLADWLTSNLASTTMAPLKTLAERLPLRIPNVDPITLFISTANAISGGRAAESLGITKEQLERHMLVRHFLQHRRMLVGSQQIWRRVPDWKAAVTLPDYCLRGQPVAAA